MKLPNENVYDFTMQESKGIKKEEIVERILVEIGKENLLERRKSNLYNCSYDKYGNSYCPSNLAKAESYWDYEDGYSVPKVGQVVDYANKESSSGGGAEVIGTVEYQYRGNGSGIDMFFRTTGAGYNKTNYIKKSSSWILDENTQSMWAGDILGELSGMYSIYGCENGGVLKYKSHNNNTMTVYMECVKENCDYPATLTNTKVYDSGEVNYNFIAQNVYKNYSMMYATRVTGNQIYRTRIINDNKTFITVDKYDGSGTYTAKDGDVTLYLIKSGSTLYKKRFYITDNIL
ncbi:hypothetical protein ACOTVS_12100, partial [Aliarcobacter butzleri]